MDEFWKTSRGGITDPKYFFADFSIYNGHSCFTELKGGGGHGKADRVREVA